MTIQHLLTISWPTGPAGSGVLPCQHEDPRLWFAERPADLEQAKAFCQPCPVRVRCLAGATERQEPPGPARPRSDPRTSIGSPGAE